MEQIVEKKFVLEVKLRMMNTGQRFTAENMTPTEIFWCWANIKNFAEKQMESMLNAKGDVN